MTGILDLSNKFDFQQCTAYQVLIYVSIFISSIIISGLIGRFTGDRFGRNKKDMQITFMMITSFITLLLLMFFGASAKTLQGIVLAITFIFCSYSDIRTMTCDDFPFLIVVVTALIGFDPYLLPYFVFSSFFIFVLMLFPLMINLKTVGGADIKFSASCAFLVGLNRGLLGLLIGVLIAVIVGKIKNREDEAFPLLPYLSIGYFIAFLI